MGSTWPNREGRARHGPIMHVCPGGLCRTTQRAPRRRGRAPVAHGDGAAPRALRTVMGRVKAGRAGSTAAGGVGGGVASPAAPAAPAPGLAASAMVCWILATICETCWSLKPLPRCLARKDRATLSGWSVASNVTARAPPSMVTENSRPSADHEQSMAAHATAENHARIRGRPGDRGCGTAN